MTEKTSPPSATKHRRKVISACMTKLGLRLDYDDNSWEAIEPDAGHEWLMGQLDRWKQEYADRCAQVVSLGVPAFGELEDGLNKLAARSETAPPVCELEEARKILQKACDRTWKDETLYQTAVIASNAIYWRDREIENLKRDRDARAREACTAEGRQGCSFAPSATLTTADYEEVLADHRRLVRELDVAMHGEEGAAKQASLCDLIPLANRLRAEASTNNAKYEGAVAACAHFAADAARYRWLRDHDLTAEYSEYHTGNLNGRGVDPLDSTVDKAMGRA